MRLIREKQGLNSTLSGLYLVDGVSGVNNFLCWCLEDKIRTVKIQKETAIPVGIYPVRFRKVGRIHANYAAKFVFHRGMLEICELPNFKFVMFHIGNDIEDTEGCPLMGDDYLKIGKEYQVKNSTSAYTKVYPMLAKFLTEGKQIVVEISNKIV